MKKKNFLITNIISNYPFENELNVKFKNKNINLNNFLSGYQEFKLKFYQKFIRKIIMNHYKTYLYKLLFKILNAKK